MLRVFGVGSPHGDDQLGWLLARELQAQVRPGLTIDALSRPLDLLDRLDPEEAVVLVDACDVGAAPGTVVIRDWPAPIESRQAASSHGLGLGAVLRLAESLGRRPRSVTLFLVQAKDCSPAGDLDGELVKRWPEIVQALCRLIADLADNAPCESHER